jgi:hypothetical protein
MTNGKWKGLATFDLRTLDCKVIPDVWNQIRIAVKGPQIKVWFNRMHPSADKQNGLRIVYEDKDIPILHGNIGLRTFATNAEFDNIIVLPLSQN